MTNTNGLKALVLVISLLGIGSAYGLGPEEAVDVDYNKAKKIAQQRAASAEAREAANKRLSQEKIDAAERKVKELEAALQREQAASQAKKSPAPVVEAAPRASSFADPFAGEMVAIPIIGRPFSMGDNGSSEKDEKPAHPVTIRQVYELGRTEVTQGQWKAVMGSNPSEFKACGDNCPVESVSWDDIQQFIKKLNEKTGKQYRLPTEAEWEYACRGGGTETYCGSNDIEAVAWYGLNSGKTAHQVAQKQKNAFGLYDMSGNVREWVQDCAHDSYNGAPDDGSEWKGSCVHGATGRVLRGGSWKNGPDYVRSAIRYGVVKAIRDVFNGFRVARMLP